MHIASKPTTAAQFKETEVVLPGLRVTIPIGLSLFLNMLPVTMIVPVLSEVVGERFSTSSFWTHAFMSINMVGAIIAAALYGRFGARRLAKKHIIVLASVVNALVLWSLSTATSVQVLFALRFIEGMAHILVLICLMACASDWAPQQSRGRIMGVVGACMMLGTSFGSPIGGRIGSIDPLLVFKMGSLIACGAGLVALLGLVEAPQHSPSKAKRTQVLVRRQPGLWVPYAYAFIDRFCVGVIISTFMLYLSDVLNLSPAQRGMQMGFFMLPFALLTYPCGRLTDRWGRAWPMAGGSLAFGLVFMSYGWVSTATLPVVMVISGILSAVMFAPSLACCADLAPEGQRSAAFAGLNISGSFGFLVGPLISGAVCHLALDHYEPITAYRIAMVCAGLTQIACAVATIPILLKLQRSKQIA